METKWPNTPTVKQIIALMTSSNVNKYVGREPLIVRYFRACTPLNLDIVTAFAANGCDFNVHGCDGQTPLHLLLAKITQKNASTGITAVLTLVTHGADPSLVDGQGNSVLIVAVTRSILSSFVLRTLTVDKAMAKKLVTHRNKAGCDVLAVYLWSL